MDLRTKVCWLVAVTAVVGCNSEPAMGPPMESPPPAKVVTRQDMASTTDCPFGGVVVASGVDDNGNGKLDDAEIKIRTPVCNEAPAQPPPVILVRLVSEPATGGHCAAGGTAVQSGPDRNGNGRLDDDEVTHTDFVCSVPVLTRLVPEPSTGGHCAAGGTAVQSGPDRNGNGRLDDDEVAHTDFVCGLAVLTRLDAEPPGDRCAAGGVVFQAGLDRDGNGVLDSTEVVSTEISCGDRIERDVDIRTTTDDFALKDVRVITGRVTVLRGNFTLPRLAQIGGALQFIEGSGGTIALPALQSVGGELALRNSGVTALACPQLRHTGSLTVIQSALPDLSGFPALAEIAGDVTISSAGLVSATLPSTSPVKIAGNLQIGGAPDLTRADWTVEDRLGNVNAGSLASFTLAVVPVHQPRSALGEVRIGSISAIRLSASEMSSIQLDGAFHDVAFDFGLVDKDLQIFAITSPFDLTLSDPAQNGQLRVQGTLRIQGPLAALHTTDAVFVEGLLQLNSTQLRELAPLGQIHAHGELDIANNPLLTLIAPIDVIGTLKVQNNGLLPTLAFARFALQGEVLGDVIVADNPVLTSAPALALLNHVHGDVLIQSNPLLAAPFGPALVQVDGGLDISSTASTELSLPNFAQVGSFVRVFGNGFGTVSMPALATVPGELLISSNDQLRSLAFGALTHAGTFTVRDNPHLPACQVVALFAHVDGEHNQTGNDDAATCAR
jgi:hypothetical protein